MRARCDVILREGLLNLFSYLVGDGWWEWCRYAAECLRGLNLGKWDSNSTQANMSRTLFHASLPLLLLLQCFFWLRVSGQSNSSDINAPFSYPGMPTTPYGPDWRTCKLISLWGGRWCTLKYSLLTLPTKDFEANATLTNVTVPLPHAYAGSVSVNRPGHLNNTLFFLAFEKEGNNGSLAANDGERINEPWIIWLNGG